MIALPLLARLYVRKKDLPSIDPKHRPPFRTKLELAVELLRKLLNDEVKARSKHNLVQARSFADLLEKSVRRYQNRAIEAAQVIEELVAEGRFLLTN